MEQGQYHTHSIVLHVMPLSADMKDRLIVAASVGFVMVYVAPRVSAVVPGLSFSLSGSSLGAAAGAAGSCIVGGMLADKVRGFI